MQQRMAPPAGQAARLEAVRVVPIRLPRTSAYQRWGKRAFDLALAVPLLVMAAPVILALAGLVVLTSGWPAFYGAPRLGRGGHPFRMWKLRTMVNGANAMLEEWKRDGHPIGEMHRNGFKPTNDPRSTKLGGCLRRLSLDELPQLWNVALGQMTLVGPRPYAADELDQAPGAGARILAVRPAITGPWQTRGRNQLAIRQRIEMDIEWVRSTTFSGDLRCLARTLSPLFSMNGR